MDQLLEALLGGLLGSGGTTAGQPGGSGGSSNTINLNDLIGMLIGQNASQGQTHHNGISDLINALIGGGAAGGNTGGNNQRINPIAQMLADRLGIPPQLAQAVVAFFISRILQKQLQNLPAGAQPALPATPAGTADDGLDLDDLLDVMGDRRTLQTRLSQSGMANDLARQTGLTPAQANAALQEVVQIVGEQRIKPRPVTTQGVNLKRLLETW